MILLVAVVTTILIAMLRGGRLRYVGRLSIRWPWLPLLAFLVQAYVVFFPAERSEGLLTLRASVLAGSYLCLLAMAWGNRRLPGIKLIALGVFMNFAVMVVNGGYMPVTPEALVTAGHQSLVYSMESGARVASSKDVILEREDTTLWWLSDVFVIPRDWPLSGSFSLGDVVIALGAFVLIQAAMLDGDLGDKALFVPLRKEIEPRCAERLMEDT